MAKMIDHAILSASGAHRWSVCTPSARLEEKFPKKSSEYAEEGTAAHALAELVARYYLGELSEMDYENRRDELAKGTYYNAEMQECANDYGRLVLKTFKAAQERSEDAFVELEARVDFSRYVKDGFGTGDCIIVADKTLEIIDFKYGKGVRVEAAGNPQMKLYAIGALLKYNTLFDIDTVRMTIFQPRLPGEQSSDEMYRFNLVTNTAATRRALLDGTYKSRGFIEFDLYDRGKMRHIRSIHISERVVQRTLCDKAVNPCLKPSFIYDNGASTQNKGITFALNRLTCHLQRHYRKHGNEGYVLLFDFSDYFAKAQHWPVRMELERRIHDERTRALANECLDNFGPIGYGLGSQISQTAALMLPNRLDHFIKEQLQIKGYARYMDDGYLIHPSKAYLQKCLARMKEICDSLGIILNTKKTKIKRLADGFKFLQVRFKLLETGKVLRKMSYESIKKMQRKLKKFRRWNAEGRTVIIGGKEIHKEFPLSDICKVYESWRGHTRKSEILKSALSSLRISRSRRPSSWPPRWAATLRN